MSDWDNDAAQRKYLKTMLEDDVQSFVLLDERERYRIEVPVQDAVK
jgi:hypothetical protein